MHILDCNIHVSLIIFHCRNQFIICRHHRFIHSWCDVMFYVNGLSWDILVDELVCFCYQLFCHVFHVIFRIHFNIYRDVRFHFTFMIDNTPRNLVNKVLFLFSKWCWCCAICPLRTLSIRRWDEFWLNLHRKNLIIFSFFLHWWRSPLTRGWSACSTSGCLREITDILAYDRVSEQPLLIKRCSV